MTLLSVLIWVGFVLAVLPLAMTVTNALFFRRLPPAPTSESVSQPAVSVLVPARDEARSIEGAVRSVLANRGVDLELIVLDDESTDGTDRIVQRIAEEDDRVRVIRGKPLPTGWCGKQYACLQLADAARHDLLVWMDADVTLSPDALARMARRIRRSDTAMLSGFPHQITLTTLERWIVPLIHVLLLGYLPMFFMRLSRRAMFAVGCGQLVMVRRDAYEAIGRHEAVRSSLHDGMTLPRAFRNAGFMTDVFDGLDVARCRMYRSAREVWSGFAKNATEGMATPVGLPVWTILLFGGFVLPWLLLIVMLLAPDAIPAPKQPLVLGAVAAMIVHGLFCRLWLRHDWQAVVARPLGICTLLAIQYYALFRHLRGRPATWKGRSQSAGDAVGVS